MPKVLDAFRVRLFLLLLVGCAGGAARAEDPVAPAVERAVHWADVSARIAKHDAPLWLQLRLEADGLLVLRSASDAAEPAWTARGAWRFTGVPAEDAAVLEGLGAGLRAALGGDDPAAARLREPDQHSAARMLVDLAPEAPWRRAQWVLATGCGPRLKIYHLTFLAPDPGTWIDVDLPKDRGGPSPAGELQAARFFEVRMYRWNEGAPSAAFTRLRIRPETRDVYGVEDVPEVLEEGEQYPPVEPGLPGRLGAPAEVLPGEAKSSDTFTIDLPDGAAPSGVHAAAWRRVAAFLNAPGPEAVRVGEIKAPPPRGAQVPAGDVIEVMLRLRDAGCVTVHFEGAAPPLARGPR